MCKYEHNVIATKNKHYNEPVEFLELKGSNIYECLSEMTNGDHPEKHFEPFSSGVTLMLSRLNCPISKQRRLSERMDYKFFFFSYFKLISDK